MSFSAPTPPDATQTSNQQQQYNLQAGQQQNQINSYNQSNPFGSINYTADPNSPSGYALNTSLSQPEQQLFNQYTGNQSQAGATAGNLLTNTASMYSQPFKLSPISSTTGRSNICNRFSISSNRIPMPSFAIRA